MASTQTQSDFISLELVKLQYDINKFIEEGKYNEAAALIKNNSEIYEFEITIADKKAEILEKIRDLN